MSAALYKLMLHIMPPEIDEIAGGQATVTRLLKEMGKISADELKLLVISLCLLFFWTTEKSFAQHRYFHQYHGGDNTFNAA